jgi:DNA-directed RNA polymerase subunit L
VSGSYGSIKPEHPEIKDPKDKVNLQFYLNVENKKDEIRDVTTNDLKIYQNGEEIDNIYPEDDPILLIKLKPTEMIKLQMVPNLGIARLNQCWTVCHCFYEEQKEHKYLLTIEPSGNLDAFTILDRACDIFIEKLQVIQDDLNKKKEETKENKIYLKFDYEDHTLGNCFNYALQIHKKTLTANYKMDHPQIRKIDIYVESEKTPVATIIDDALNYLIQLYQEIKNKVAKLNKEGKKEKPKKTKKKSEK